MRIQIPDINIAYEDSGPNLESTPIILFIHGYPLSRKLWQPQLSDLSEFARILIPDLRGFGDSDATPGPYTMDLLADDCICLLDRLEIIKPVIVCGLSMGGYVTFALYRKYPHRVKGLILVSTRAGADSLEVKLNRDKSVDLTEKEGSEAITRVMLPKMLSPDAYNSHPEMVNAMRSITMSASVPGIVGVLKGMRNRPDSTPLLSQITVPTLLIFGEEDQLIPRSEIETLRDSIPGAQLHTIPNAGHVPNFEQPNLFNRMIEAYITSFSDKQ